MAKFLSFHHFLIFHVWLYFVFIAGVFESGSKCPPKAASYMTNPSYMSQPVYETIHPQYSLPQPIPPSSSSFTANSSNALDSMHDSINKPVPYSYNSEMSAFPPILDDSYTIMKSAVRQ